MDIIICQSKQQLTTWTDKKDAYDNFLRFKEIKSYYDTMSEVLQNKWAYPDVNFRSFVMPSKELGPRPAMLNFKNSSTWNYQLIGREDGKKAVSMPDGFFFDEMLAWS